MGGNGSIFLNSTSAFSRGLLLSNCFFSWKTVSSISMQSLIVKQQIDKLREGTMDSITILMYSRQLYIIQLGMLQSGSPLLTLVFTNYSVADRPNALATIQCGIFLLYAKQVGMSPFILDTSLVQKISSFSIITLLKEFIIHLQGLCFLAKNQN